MLRDTTNVKIIIPFFKSLCLVKLHGVLIGSGSDTENSKDKKEITTFRARKVVNLHHLLLEWNTLRFGYLPGLSLSITNGRILNVAIKDTIKYLCLVAPGASHFFIRR